MRKNTARHWLHATLDLLPVLLIPVFMIYSHRHNVGTDVTIQEPVYYDTNEVTDVNSLIIGNAYKWTNNWITDTTYANNNLFYLESTDNIKELFTNYPSNATRCSLYVLQNGNVQLNALNGNQFVGYANINNLRFDFVLQNTNEYTIGALPYLSSTELVDYYTSVVIHNTIMDSFVSEFNNTINKYFNMGNVFNMRNVYEWFNTNIFGGNAPTIMFSVYNIIVYEFVMDLLFLLYGLFMWFVDMLKRLIEKPINSIK